MRHTALRTAALCSIIALNSQKLGLLTSVAHCESLWGNSPGAWREGSAWASQTWHPSCARETVACGLKPKEQSNRLVGLANHQREIRHARMAVSSPCSTDALLHFSYTCLLCAGALWPGLCSGWEALREGNGWQVWCSSKLRRAGETIAGLVTVGPCNLWLAVQRYACSHSLFHMPFSWGGGGVLFSMLHDDTCLSSASSPPSFCSHVVTVACLRTCLALLLFSAAVLLLSWFFFVHFCWKSFVVVNEENRTF